MRMRIRVGTDRDGSSLLEWGTAEWVGRAGHPSSYGLLTVTRAARPSNVSTHTGTLFTDAMTSADTVLWGLPQEYEVAIAPVLKDAPQELFVAEAAHGMIGSSQQVFGSLARFLCRVLAMGIPYTEEEIWDLWDRCWSA
jgi:hypothetical protein